MPRVQLSDTIINRIRRDVDSHTFGERRIVVEEWAEKLNVSPATVYRKIKITKGTKTAARTPEVPDKVIMQIGKMKAESMLRGRKGRMLRTDDCIRIMEQSGEIPKGSVSRSTVDSRLRKMGWNQKRAYTRHEPEYVNQVHIYDFSVSDYVSIVRKGRNDWTVRFEKGAFSSYKNKDELGNKKLWLCSMMDTYSRLPIMLYLPSPGENLEMMASFMNYVYRPQDDFNTIYLPDELHLDQGSIGKNADFTSRMDDVLGVRVQMSASKSDRHADHQSAGKIERQFRTYWQTENFLSYVLHKKGIKEIQLSELNAMLKAECEILAGKDHPTRREHSKLDVYATGLQRRAELFNLGKVERPNQPFAGDFFEVLYSNITRKVDATGLISIDKVYYEISDKQFINENITVIKDQHGRMMGQYVDPQTGEVHEFGVNKFDPDNARPKAPEQTFRQKLVQSKDDEIDFSNVSLSRADADDEETNIKRLKPASEILEAQTPFAEKPEVAMMSYDDAREYICDATGLPWDEIPSRLKATLEMLFQANKLDRELLDDLASTVAS